MPLSIACTRIPRRPQAICRGRSSLVCVLGKMDGLFVCPGLRARRRGSRHGAELTPLTPFRRKVYYGDEEATVRSRSEYAAVAL